MPMPEPRWPDDYFELVGKTAAKMLRTCRHRPLKETLTGGKALTITGWE